MSLFDFQVTIDIGFRIWLLIVTEQKGAEIFSAQVTTGKNLML